MSVHVTITKSLEFANVNVTMNYALVAKNKYLHMMDLILQPFITNPHTALV